MKKRLTLKVNPANTGWQTYAHYSGYLKQEIEALARCFPRNWEWSIEAE